MKLNDVRKLNKALNFAYTPEFQCTQAVAVTRLASRHGGVASVGAGWRHSLQRVCVTADIGLGKGNNPSDVLQEKVNPE